MFDEFKRMYYTKKMENASKGLRALMAKQEEDHLKESGMTPEEADQAWEDMCKASTNIAIEEIKNKYGEDHNTKVFLSLPMHGKTNEEISERIDKISNDIENLFDGKCEIVHNFNKENNVDAFVDKATENDTFHQFDYLKEDSETADNRFRANCVGKAIEKLSFCDVMIVDGGDYNDMSSGMRIENDVCELYDIPVIYYY